MGKRGPKPRYRPKTDRGYVLVWNAAHHRAQKPWGYVYEHILIVEGVLNKPLLPPAVVHHVNGDRADNRNCNLVVCQDNAYHTLLHRRQRALDECGNPNWRRCVYCGRHDSPDALVPHTTGSSYAHRSCRSADHKARKARRVAASAQHFGGRT